ncbi:MAG: acyl-CoA dehydrogenase [Planctomycetota bacterium]|nr:MAG: acyl-CoA dehydrogenase [Planctomycetota bacterium]
MSTAAEREARKTAESARESKWRGHSFLKDLFLGRFRLDLVHPYPAETPERPKFRDFYGRLRRLLEEKVDPAAIDTSGEYPPEVVRGLAEIGAFGMKIPEEYGGLGLTHPEYVRAMELLGSHDANVTALLSAHQAIGVPQPVKLFGSDALKRKYLPRCARGAISAFALTEPAVGSDPGSLATVAELSADGSHYVMNGEKLWCTNGTLADLLVVMARNPQTRRINAFVVETGWEGVRLDHRCHFMGLRALANGVISFHDVKVPRENLIGAEGMGLKIALTTLNTGRLSLPAATTGGTKACLEIARKWSKARVQWGAPIGRHEAIAHKLADLGASAYAMESLAFLVGAMADREDLDIRLEAAAAKEWNTARYWRMADETLQIRGGRGYETESSLGARGEPAVGVERMVRDARINVIFEGSSEIMHLFMAREAVDKHLQVAGTLIDPETPLGAKLAALPRIGLFYALWYSRLWLRWSGWPRYAAFGRLARHLRFADAASVRLGRAIFHGMLVHRARLERKQGFLFRIVDIAMELFALTAGVARAQRMRELRQEGWESAQKLADLAARAARRRVQQLFHEVWSNDDELRYRAGRSILDGEHLWLEHGIMNLPYDEQDLVPPDMQEILARRAQAPVATRV